MHTISSKEASSNLGLIDSVGLVVIRLVLCVKLSVFASPAKAIGSYLIVPFAGVCEENSALLVLQMRRFTYRSVRRTAPSMTVMHR